MPPARRHWPTVTLGSVSTAAPPATRSAASSRRPQRHLRQHDRRRRRSPAPGRGETQSRGTSSARMPPAQRHWPTATTASVLAAAQPGNTIGGTASTGSQRHLGQHRCRNRRLRRFHVSAGDAVAGNFIGTDVSGQKLARKRDRGVSQRRNATTIGGTSTGAGNVISGDPSPESGCSGNTVSRIRILGNLIGTDPTGRLPIVRSGSIRSSPIPSGSGGGLIGSREKVT